MGGTGGEGGRGVLVTEALSRSLGRGTARNHIECFRKLSCLELTFGLISHWLLWFQVQIEFQTLKEQGRWLGKCTGERVWVGVCACSCG